MGRDRVLTVQHAADCPPARLGGWLTDAGIDLDVVACHAGGALPESLEDCRGLLVLGGEMGAYDDAVAPWLPQTRRLLADAVERAVPTLAVCLGHQLLAVATGGRVEPSPTGPQIGALPVRLTRAGRADRLLGPVGATASAVHWNNDSVVELPAGAVELARTDAGVQAVRLGDAAWGVQFHPEVGVAELRPWAAADVGAGRLDPELAEDRLTGIAAADPGLQRTWSAFTQRFAERVRTDRLRPPTDRRASASS